MNRSKLEVFYSIGIILAIPILLAINTILLVSSTRSTFDIELSRKSDLVNSVIAQQSIADVQDKQYDRLSVSLEEIETAQPAIRQLQVITKDETGIRRVAQGVDRLDEINPSVQTQVNIVYERKQPVARFINFNDNGVNSQAWNVATPILDSEDTVLGVVVSSILTNDAEELIDSAYTKSFIVMVVSIIVIVILLFRHFRLVGYVQLLAKQRELNQTMSDFLSVATHELKSPTTVIKGNMENLCDGLYGPVDDKIKDQLGVVISQTDRMNSLVQDLLNVSRIEQGRIEYTITDVDSARVLQSIVDVYKGPAQNKGLELRYEPVENIPIVRVDEGRLQEIFTNLIDNAIKYTETGSVTVSQKVVNNKVVTSVKDTGFGMSPEASKRLFQRFYRIKTDKTRTISGTGLGLWIIKKYIESMGGTIEVESLEGSGSNFIVSFPVKG